MCLYIFTCKVVVTCPFIGQVTQPQRLTRRATNSHVHMKDSTPIHRRVLHIHMYVDEYAHRLIDTVGQALSCSQKGQVHVCSHSPQTHNYIYSETVICTYRGPILTAGLEADSVR